jgi:xylulose-5-phosphate/fructose-6-phosphate phosphoketolase
LSGDELHRVDAYWRAANYLSVGQIYLMGNPLLREPLLPEQVKPRLLGHWGTTPGLNLLYAHLSRIVAARSREVMYVTGPGHGGPGLVANTWPYLVLRFGTYDPADGAAPRTPRLSTDQTIERS